MITWAKQMAGLYRGRGRCQRDFSVKRHGRRWFATVDGTHLGSAETMAEAMALCHESLVYVCVDIGWGRQWNGSYYQETKGYGSYVAVTEASGHNSFRGCPLGSSSSIYLAIRDFVARGGSEYLRGQLHVGMIEIKERNDRRVQDDPQDGLTPFLTALQEEPQERLHLLAMADWMEENGLSHQAGGARLLASLKAWPVHAPELTTSVRDSLFWTWVQVNPKYKARAQQDGLPWQIMDNMTLSRSDIDESLPHSSCGQNYPDRMAGYGTSRRAWMAAIDAAASYVSKNERK